MSASDHRTLTRRWLRQNIAPYANQDIVYSHVDAVLTAHPTLRPKTDVYIFDDGRSQLMLCVHGLLPIVFRGSTYNIPVSVWLPHAYPAEPPIVYVVPTSDMLVRASKFVDISGRCNFPYTQLWQSKSEGCHLIALIDVLVDAFSTQPPVYAKPASTTSSPPPPPPPPRPIPTSSSSSPPPPLPPSHTRPRTQSPKPFISPHPNVNEHRHYRAASTHAHSTLVQDPPMYTTPTPYFVPPSTSSPHPPPRPPPQPPQPPQPHPQPSILLHQPIPSLRYTTTAPRSSPLQGPQPYPPPQPQPQPHPWQHPYRPPFSSHSLPPSGPPPLSHSTRVRNYLEEDIEDVPVPSPQAAPPPRPPNPEILKLYNNVLAKIDSEYFTLEHSLNTDLQRLRTAQSDLLAGQAAIHDEIGRLQAVRDVCRTVADRYQTTIFTAESNLQDLRRKGDPEVDELICSTSIVYNQLIDLVAEDNAIEDSIYHLHRALNAGKLDLEKFLKTTRALAEEQFMKRALAQKIVSSLPMVSWGSQYT